MRRDAAPSSSGTVVPDELAGELVRAALAELRRQAETHGERIPPGGRRLLGTDAGKQLLRDLSAAAQRDAGIAPVTGASSACGTEPAGSSTLDGKVIATVEAASRLQCTVRYVRKLCETGRLPARRLGRDWLITEHHLNEYRYGRSPA
jgi:excisionase family DNA binding protein